MKLHENMRREQSALELEYTGDLAEPPRELLCKWILAKQPLQNHKRGQEMAKNASKIKIAEAGIPRIWRLI